VVNKVLYTLKVPLNFFNGTSVVCQELSLLEGLTNYILLVRADRWLIVRLELNYLPTDTFQRFIETPLLELICWATTPPVVITLLTYLQYLHT